MIQRIQTLYLLLVVILGTLLCFFSPIQFLPSEGTAYFSLCMLDKWPLTVMAVVVPLFALVNIFLFRNRMLQARLNVVNAIFSFGQCALIALYGVFVVKGYEAIDGMLLAASEWYLSIWAAIPLVNVVLLMMATRRILKDEALVRAADRLR